MNRSARRHSIQQTVQLANRALVKQVRAATGADSPAVVKSAAVLARKMREVLSVPAPGRRASLKSRRVQGGEPSRAGQPPRMQSERLKRSIKHAVVEGVRRVGTGNFRGRLLEFGVIAAGRKSRPSKRKGAKGAMTKASRPIVIAPRPWARPALEQARAAMVDVVVSELRKQGGDFGNVGGAA